MKIGIYTLALATTTFFAAAGPITKRHTTLQYISVNGIDQSQSALRLPGTNAPVTSVTSADITCNVKNVGVSGLITAKAGDTVITEYHHDNSRTSEFVDPSHKGMSTKPIPLFNRRQADMALLKAQCVFTWEKSLTLGLPLVPEISGSKYSKMAIQRVTGDGQLIGNICILVDTLFADDGLI